MTKSIYPLLRRRRPTDETHRIWSDFIPKDQASTFTQGGYYSVPAAHSALLLISLNSLLFYDANTAVRGCPADDPLESGNQHLLWIEGELSGARRKGQQVWFTGHVAPNGWVANCYEKYGRIVSSYQDTILGFVFASSECLREVADGLSVVNSHIFGHSNLDSFFWIDAKNVFPSTTSSFSPSPPSVQQLVLSPPATRTKFSNSSDRFETGFYTQLKELSQKESVDHNDYTIINMEPSIIPTYFPGFRLWQYDVSHKEKGKKWRQIDGDEERDEEEGKDYLLEEAQGDVSTLRFSQRTSSPAHPTDLSYRHRHTSPHSPSRRRSVLTPLGYTQYYLPLPLVNENSGYGPGSHGAALLKKHGEHGVRPTAGWEIEYTTYTAENLARSLLGKSDQPPAIPLGMLPSGIAEVVRKYRTRSGEGVEGLRKVLEGRLNLVSYEMEDLTIGSWLRLGKTLGRSETHWKLYLKRMFVSTGIERSW